MSASVCSAWIYVGIIISAIKLAFVLIHFWCCALYLFTSVDFLHPWRGRGYLPVDFAPPGQCFFVFFSFHSLFYYSFSPLAHLVSETKGEHEWWSAFLDMFITKSQSNFIRALPFSLKKKNLVYIIFPSRIIRHHGIPFLLAPVFHAPALSIFIPDTYGTCWNCHTLPR